MLTRRQVLAGIGGLTVLGVAGAALDHAVDPRVRRGLRRLGLAESPDGHVPDSHTKEISGSLTTRNMPRPVAWTISMPSEPVEGVIYCLHSYGNDQRMAFDNIHLPDVVAAAGAPLAVAAVDGGRTAYWHERADRRDPLAMLLDEFIPMVDARFAAGRRRALVGWSMGGYGALSAAERVPARFDAVAAASPALFHRPSDVPATAFDGSADYRANNVFTDVAQLAAVTVRIDCGNDDPFVDEAKRFVARLPGRNHGRFSAGFHDEAYWRSIAPAQVDTIADVVRRASA
jgi:pimeloyl-ACP methyl ester carboxylesterase